ncbi:unnamed protein product [Dovyalis caffra]|uniref:Pentatricopeptide repeat-containing protein n=1 Tax=Dovyalis caffra TaxID=77055 RepID=A0AAV1QQW3_9ROSI|nr:unnamed protein product [Dovyalis caffra]
MENIATKLIKSLLPYRKFLLQFRTLSTSQTPLEETLKATIESKSYTQIPDLFNSFKQSNNNPSPFSFLSTFPFNLRTQVIDEIIQSLIPIRPRFRNSIVYSSLLSYTLQSSDLFPLSLSIIQCTLRSGCLPVPQTHVSLSSAWLDRRRDGQSVGGILMEMKSIGYNPDCGLCNYIMLSLCNVDQLIEAVKVLKDMGKVGCFPDLESYGIVIGAMCRVRKCDDAIEMVKEMVVKMRLSPRQGVVVKVLAALRANREMRKAGEMVEFLEKEEYGVGFEGYESLVEGCLECKDFILAVKIVTRMTEKGFIPYIKVRQKVVEGLIDAGECKLACTVRQRFAELSS